ncbi:MAG TPA: alpha/beta hydrolase [Mycobacterium sp.]|nr:alpha/beta hydrolase [Mycobacterium sp.]
MVPVEIIEDGPGIAARLVSLASRLTIKPALAVGGLVPLPGLRGVIDVASRIWFTAPKTIRRTMDLPNATAQLVRAPGVRYADGTGRVVLYLHGGGFASCGATTHGRLVAALSEFADAPVLFVNYRLIPQHSIGMALQDCYDGYRLLLQYGYRPEQIVVAGDSAGGYLALALAQRLADEDEEPAALVAISPLLQLAAGPKQDHPNSRTDAMFPPQAFATLMALVAHAGAAHLVDGQPEPLYEPLNHVEPGLPPTLIHVSGAEVLLHDARLAARTLAAAGVPTEVRVWPGQVHDFQLAGPIVPEATRSLRQIGAFIREATP